jgi:hypothetical protein
MMKERSLKRRHWLFAGPPPQPAARGPTFLKGELFMRKSLLSIIGLISFSAASLRAQNAQSISGTISDSMCGAHHMMKNLTPAQCTRECVKQGSDYALVVGSKVYTLKGDKAQIDKFAGQKVTIKGETSGDTITVKSISTVKS